MRDVTRQVDVALAGRSYPVLIGPGLVAQAGSHVKPLLRRPIAVVVADETVDDLHGSALEASLRASGLSVHKVLIPSGEASKSFAELERLCNRLLELGLERTDVLIAFGGGVIGDLAGFAAAIVKRGADFVQIPTTLLAQVDSSVGGKTAIDTPRGKNMIGAFHQPRLVLADLDVLSTLSDREMICGYAEVIKYALLGDATFFEWLETEGATVLARGPEALLHAVTRSVAMKAEIVAEDERENGRRALLNLGHTFGHALEALSGYGDTVKHGEAVGLGCAMAFRFSAALGFCQALDAMRVESALIAAGLPTRLRDLPGGPFRVEPLIAAMAQDKKTEGGTLTFVLVRAIGEAFIAKAVDPDALRAFLRDEGALDDGGRDAGL